MDMDVHVSPSEDPADTVTVPPVVGDAVAVAGVVLVDVAPSEVLTCTSPGSVAPLLFVYGG